MEFSCEELWTSDNTDCREKCKCKRERERERVCVKKVRKRQHDSSVTILCASQCSLECFSRSTTTMEYRH